MWTNGRNRKLWAVAAVAGLALGLGPATRAGEGESPRGAQEGIKVHGDWTIDVRDPDGSLVSHNEFKNALTEAGKRNLTRLLSGLEGACEWHILIDEASTLLMRGLLRECSEGTHCISVSADDTLLTLRGRLDPRITHDPAASTWGIGRVRTHHMFRDLVGGRCSSPAPSELQPDKAFTQRTLDTPITVLPDQSVDVKVVFSFS